MEAQDNNLIRVL